MTYDPNNPEHVRVEQSKKRLRDQQRLADWKWVVSDPRGQRIVRDLVAPLLASSFHENPLTMAFLEGQREIARSANRLAAHAGFDALAATLAAEAPNVRSGDDTGSDDGDASGDEPGGG